MPKTVTVRFYEIGKMAENGPSLRTALQQIFESGQAGDRQVQLSEGFVGRLERLTTNVAGYVSGEMLRVRDTDFPCEVHADQTRTLNVDTPLGDGISFCFREADSRLAIQYDPRTFSPGRMFDYISQWNGVPLFTYQPAIDDQAIQRFRQQPLRKLTIRLASPQHLAAVEDGAAPVVDAVQQLAEDYDAPTVSIELSMGRNKGSLAEGTKLVAEGFLQMLGNGTADVRSLKVTPDSGEGIENEDINLLDQILSDRDEIASPGNDPAVIYTAVSTFVRQRLDQHGQG